MIAKFFKKQWIGFYACLLGIICCIVAISIYSYTISWIGSYWWGDNNTHVVSFSVWAIILFFLAPIIANLADFLGEKIVILKPICHYVAGALVIVAICLALAGMITMVSDRVEGLGYILASDATVQAQVQTPNNMTSVSLTITTIVFYAIGAILPIIGCFFPIVRDVETPNAEKVAR